jgi:hypothetical protein
VEHVERDDHHREVFVAMEHPLAKVGEAGFAVVAERDQLAVQRQVAWKGGEFGEVRRHLPPLAAEDAEPAGGGDEAAESVRLEFVGVVTRGERAAAGEHPFGEWSHSA